MKIQGDLEWVLHYDDGTRITRDDADNKNGILDPSHQTNFDEWLQAEDAAIAALKPGRERRP